MDKKIIGTVAAIGTIAYLYSKDVFNAEPQAHDSDCINGQYNTMPAKKKNGIKFSKITLDGLKKDSSDNSKRWYNVTNYIHRTTGSQGTRDDKIKSKSYQGIKKAMKYAKKWKYTPNLIFIHDVTGDYCYQEEKPSNQDEEEEGTVTEAAPDTSDFEGTVEVETSSGSTDWCAVKAKSPARLKEIKGEIAEEHLKIKKDYEDAVDKAKQVSNELSAKLEKEGAAELKRINDRYEESKEECSAREEVQKKLQDSGATEGFWEKLLAYLNA